MILALEFEVNNKFKELAMRYSVVTIDRTNYEMFKNSEMFALSRICSQKYVT